MLLLGLAAPSLARAEIIAFKHFSINMPPAWRYSEDGDLVSVAAKDNSSILVFSPDKLPAGQNLQEFALAFSQSCQGGAPVAKSAGTFQFDYKNEVGADAHVVISQADPLRASIFLIIIVGEKHPELPAILSSVKINK